MGLQLYNTLTRRKEAFEPLRPPQVGMYVCGPTVYGHAHLGHAKSYVHFDVINRYLRFGLHRLDGQGQSVGWLVQYVQNITDVGHLTDNADEGEDKIISEARRRGLHPMAVADFFTRSYEQDMTALNVLPPDIAPRASGHIPEQIELVERLIASGHAYATDRGNVYFSVNSFAGYGKLSGRQVELQAAGARVDVRSDKRDPSDFALWKAADGGHIMQWPSPWSRGYPGWHLECSAMSMKYLGEQFDIHGGGLENQFPHHECEICQSEAATGSIPFVRYWLHNNMVTVNGTKMGKSLGNFITLKELFSGSIEDPARARTVSLTEPYGPMVVRFLILQSHYRSPIDFSDTSLQAAKAGLDRLVSLWRRANSLASGGQPAANDHDDPAVQELQVAATDAMNDDINTAAAMASLFDAGRLLAQSESDPTMRGVRANAVRELFETVAIKWLGLDLPRLAEPGADQQGHSALSTAVQMLIELRQRARKNGDFESSDAIRKQLADAGVDLLDGKQGTTWQLRR